jgi:hypothetical protein
MFICISFVPARAPSCEDKGETGPAAPGSGWPSELHYYLIRRFHVPAHHASGICETIHAILVHGITRFAVRNLWRMARDRSERLAARPADIGLGNLASNADWKRAPRQEVDGRAADRQLQRAGRQARAQAAVWHLHACSDGVMKI